MKIVRLAKMYAILLAASLFLFAFFGSSLLDLLKLVAFSTAMLILYAFFYPNIRGVKKGDTVLITTTSPGIFSARLGKAMNDAKLGEEIKVMLSDGRELVGVVTDYESLLSPARVRMLFERSQSKEVIR